MTDSEKLRSLARWFDKRDEMAGIDQSRNEVQRDLRRIADELEAEASKDDLGALRAAIQAALNELGVPGEGYPAPVANAVDILRAALSEAPSDE